MKHPSLLPTDTIKIITTEVKGLTPSQYSITGHRSLTRYCPFNTNNLEASGPTVLTNYLVNLLNLGLTCYQVPNPMLKKVYQDVSRQLTVTRLPLGTSN